MPAKDHGISQEGVPPDVPAVVHHNRGVTRWAHAAANHLAEQPKRLCRAQYDDAIDRWRVETFRENRHGRDDIDTAGFKVSEAALADILGGFPIDMRSFISGELETLDDFL